MAITKFGNMIQNETLQMMFGRQYNTINCLMTRIGGGRTTWRKCGNVGDIVSRYVNWLIFTTNTKAMEITVVE